MQERGSHSVRFINGSTGIITQYAGTGSSTGGYAGDGGPATAATLNSPRDLFVDPEDGSVYIPGAWLLQRRRLVGQA